jgi:glycosyltransferase involved in cell wall biosynthesis
MMTVLINSGLRHLYRNAAHVIAIAPTMRKLLHERGVPPDKTSVILNWSPIDVAPNSGIDPMVRRMLGRAARTLAVFAGTIGTVQDVETIVRAAALCRHEVPLDVAVIGTGTGADSARRLATDLGADNVRFIGPLGVSEMPGVYAASDYQLVTLKNSPAFRGTIPSKLGAALAHGSPIITTVPGDVTDMCESGRFGFSAAPEDPEALAGTFSRACATSSAERKRMSCAARDFYETNMSKKSAVDAVQSILADVARR